jgi:hypothetical protein
LYNTESPNDEVLWDDTKLEINSSEPSPKTPFVQSLEESNKSLDSHTFDFENDVKSWVDYLLPLFHSRTVNIIKEYLHNSTERSFDLFTYGRNLWLTEQFSDDFSDRIRSYVEECDLMQGFQVRTLYILCIIIYYLMLY